MYATYRRHLCLSIVAGYEYNLANDDIDMDVGDSQPKPCGEDDPGPQADRLGGTHTVEAFSWRIEPTSFLSASYLSLSLPVCCTGSSQDGLVVASVQSRHCDDSDDAAASGSSVAGMAGQSHLHARAVALNATTKTFD